MIKYLKMTKILLYTMALVYMSLFIKCSDDDFPAPRNVSLGIDMNDKTITCQTIAKEVDEFIWDFGDGNSIVAEDSVSHTYDEYGDYIVTLTVKGLGGEKTVFDDIKVLSPFDFLTGGEGNSKTWVLSTDVLNGSGAYKITQGWGQEDAHMIIPEASYATIIGNEFPNEFTFGYDKSYAVNAKDETVLASKPVWSYLYKEVLGLNPSYKRTMFGLCSCGYTPREGATFDFVIGGDFSVEAYFQNPITEVLTGPETVSFENVNYFTVSNEFFGILDFTTIDLEEANNLFPVAETQKYIVRKITEDEMVVALPINGLNPDLDKHKTVFWANPNQKELGPSKYAFRPTFYLNVTYVVKE
jgi:hypothetical protein